MRKPTLTITLEYETYTTVIDCMKAIGEDPEKRGTMAQYIEDAVKFKNALVKLNKWVPTDSVDFKATKIGR